MTMTTAHQHKVDFNALCHQQGVHFTEQRRCIWEYFSSEHQGHTIAEATLSLAKLGIGRATIYRTVELFERMHLLTSLRDDAGKKRYGAICPGHAHMLICRACHNVVEFDECDLNILEKLLTSKTGYAIDGHHLEIYGTCPACVGL